jgi:hypothetical protein
MKDLLHGTDIEDKSIDECQVDGLSISKNVIEVGIHKNNLD